MFSRSVLDKVDDNEVHLISLIRDRNNFTVSSYFIPNFSYLIGNYAYLFFHFTF